MARRSTEGSWAIVTPEGRTILENSEIRALRTAVAMNAKVKFVKFGTAIEDGESYGGQDSTVANKPAYQVGDPTPEGWFGADEIPAD